MRKRILLFVFLVLIAALSTAVLITSSGQPRPSPPATVAQIPEQLESRLRERTQVQEELEKYRKIEQMKERHPGATAHEFNGGVYYLILLH